MHFILPHVSRGLFFNLLLLCWISRAKNCAFRANPNSSLTGASTATRNTSGPITFVRAASAGRGPPSTQDVVADGLTVLASRVKPRAYDRGGGGRGAAVARAHLDLPEAEDQLYLLIVCAVEAVNRSHGVGSMRGASEPGSIGRPRAALTLVHEAPWCSLAMRAPKILARRRLGDAGQQRVDAGWLAAAISAAGAFRPRRRDGRDSPVGVELRRAYAHLRLEHRPLR